MFLYNVTLRVIHDFRLTRWLIIDVNSVLGLYHRVDVSKVFDLLKLQTASVFKVEVCRLVSF
jgi:hypothetical protein